MQHSFQGFLALIFSVSILLPRFMAPTTVEASQVAAIVPGNCGVVNFYIQRISPGEVQMEKGIAEWGFIPTIVVIGTVEGGVDITFVSFNVEWRNPDRAARENIPPNDPRVRGSVGRGVQVDRASGRHNGLHWITAEMSTNDFWGMLQVSGYGTVEADLYGYATILYADGHSANCKFAPNSDRKWIGFEGDGGDDPLQEIMLEPLTAEPGLDGIPDIDKHCYSCDKKQDRADEQKMWDDRALVRDPLRRTDGSWEAYVRYRLAGVGSANAIRKTQSDSKGTPWYKWLAFNRNGYTGSVDLNEPTCWQGYCDMAQGNLPQYVCLDPSKCAAGVTDFGRTTGWGNKLPDGTSSHDPRGDTPRNGSRPPPMDPLRPFPFKNRPWPGFSQPADDGSPYAPPTIGTYRYTQGSVPPIPSSYYAQVLDNAVFAWNAEEISVREFAATHQISLFGSMERTIYEATYPCPEQFRSHGC